MLMACVGGIPRLDPGGAKASHAMVLVDQQSMKVQLPGGVGKIRRRQPQMSWDTGVGT